MFGFGFRTLIWSIFSSGCIRSFFCSGFVSTGRARTCRHNCDSYRVYKYCSSLVASCRQIFDRGAKLCAYGKRVTSVGLGGNMATRRQSVACVLQDVSILSGVNTCRKVGNKVAAQSQTRTHRHTWTYTASKVAFCHEIDTPLCGNSFGGASCATSVSVLRGAQAPKG